MKRTIETFNTFNEANAYMIECRCIEAENKADYLINADEDEKDNYFGKEYKIEIENNEYKVVEFDS